MGWTTDVPALLAWYDTPNAACTTMGPALLNWQRQHRLLEYNDPAGLDINYIHNPVTMKCELWGTGTFFGGPTPVHYEDVGYATRVVDVPNALTPSKSNGTPNCPAAAGEPCNAGTGNEFQAESDYQGGDSGVSLKRYYNSQLGADFNFGFGWTSSILGKHLDISSASIGIFRADGGGETFTKNASGAWMGDADTKLALTQDASGFMLSLQDGSVEHYDTNGKLLTVTDRSGKITTYGYEAQGRLVSVTDSFGHSITIGYDATNHLASVTDPAGQIIHYSYDANNNLTRVDYPDGTAKLYHYENSSLPHNLTGISYVDASGNVARFTTIAYDANGKTVMTEHAGGEDHTTLSYDSDTQTTVADAVGTEERLTFSENLGLKNLLVRIYQTDGKGLQQSFDGSNNLQSQTDAEGRTTTYAYDAYNRRTSMTQAAGTPLARTTTYQYLADGLNLPTVIKSPSVAAGQHNTTTIQYGDSSHPDLPTTITQNGFTPSGATVSRTITLGYNGSGQVRSINGPRTDVNDITTMSYYDCTTGGACGQLKSLTNALGQVTTFDSYDADGRLLQKTDLNGLKTAYVNDARGLVTTITQTPPSGAARVTQYSYTAAGDVASIRFPDGRTLSYSYDAARLLRQVTDNLGNQIRYGYDLKGNRTQEYTYDPGNTLVRQIDYAFDLRNYLAQINSAGSLTQQIHDAVGNLVQQVDPNHNPASQYSYDPLNRLMQMVNGLGGTTGYAYDAHDKATQVAAPNGATTRYVYDDLGNLLQETSPDRGTIVYTHDVAGNVTSQTDARGITANYQYDALNRVVSIQYRHGLLGGSSDEDVTYSFDNGTGCTFGVGRLCTVQDQSGLTRYAYDAFGNVVEERHTELNALYVTKYAYDAADRIIRITYPDGRVIDYGRDPLGRLTTVSATVNNHPTTVASGMTYRADGLLTAQTFGNGISESRGFDLQGRLVNQAIGNIDTWNYGYDANGNLASRQMHSEVDSYNYDALDRLIAERLAQAATIIADYQYDANGNRAAKDTQAYIYLPDSNQLTQVGDRQLTLDAAGNTTEYGPWRYDYSRAGRLETVRHGWALKGTYAYDAQGRRTCKRVHDEVTVYHYDLAGNLILETRADGYPIRAYVYAERTPVAQIDVKGHFHEDHDQAKSYQERLAFLHTDALGTPRLATNAHQAIVWSWKWDAFGAKVSDEKGRFERDREEEVNRDLDDRRRIEVNLRFPGQYYDQETGLHYNWMRYYDPKRGRYISADPASVVDHVEKWKARLGKLGQTPLEINPYAFVANNPLRWIDPTGLVLLPPGALPGTDRCKPEEGKYCEGQCPYGVAGCYVTLKWRIIGVRDGQPIRSMERTVNCNCKEPPCQPNPNKPSNYWWAPLIPLISLLAP